MRSSHSIHLSNQKMKCIPGVALYKDIKCFWKGLDVEEIWVKKYKIFGFLGHNVLRDMSELLAPRRWKVALAQTYA